MPKQCAYFDSQSAAAATLDVSVYTIRAAKRAGCPAFRSGRVYREELLRWLDDNRDTRFAEERELRLQREKLRLERETFEFGKLKERMVPVSQFELAWSRIKSAFTAEINALGPRINAQLDGLDFNERAEVLDSEVRAMLTRLGNNAAEYLGPVADED